MDLRRYLRQVFSRVPHDHPLATVIESTIMHCASQVKRNYDMKKSTIETSLRIDETGYIGYSQYSVFLEIFRFNFHLL